MCAGSSSSFRVTASYFSFFFFFNDTATTEIYTLSLHDALPICGRRDRDLDARARCRLLHPGRRGADHQQEEVRLRSEEHTSELQSRRDLVCRLLLEKKKKQITYRFLMTRYIQIYSPLCLYIFIS